MLLFFTCALSKTSIATYYSFFWGPVIIFQCHKFSHNLRAKKLQLKDVAENQQSF
jgi:hypothetical protein